MVGQGSYGQVFRIQPGEVVKCSRNYNTICPRMLLREVAVLKHAAPGSPHLVQLTPAGSGRVQISANALCMRMEDGGSNMGDLLRYGRVARHEVVPYLRQLLLGILHLHLNGILHCDIKPTNLLVKGGHLRLCDFGMAVPEKARPQDKHVQTRWYRAPEVELFQTPYDAYSFPIDAWSAGCILGELLFSTYEQATSGRLAPMFPSGYSEHSAFSPSQGNDRLHLPLVIAVLRTVYHEHQLPVEALNDQWDSSVCLDALPQEECAHTFTLRHAPRPLVSQLLAPLLLPWAEARLTIAAALDQLDQLEAPTEPRPSSPPAPEQLQEWMGMSEESAAQTLAQVVQQGLA